MKWSSYVETQLKRLCDQIFKDHREQLIELRIYPRPFSKEECCDAINDECRYCQSFFIGLKFSRSERGMVDLRATVSQFCTLLDMNRVNKQQNNLRIMYHSFDQLAPNLVQNF